MTVNLVDSYNQHAGKVWQTLHSHGSLSEQKLLEITALSPADLASAIGWLARENKIFKQGIMYKLGETNLTATIGINGGKIWRVLDIWNDVDLPSLQRLIRIEETDVFSAVGWLAKEGKIEVTQSGLEKKSMRIWLK